MILIFFTPINSLKTLYKSLFESKRFSHQNSTIRIAHKFTKVESLGNARKFTPNLSLGNARKLTHVLINQSII